MIFAAGLGTRLYPITSTMPKAMVEVGGKPMLQLVIEKLKSAGVHKIVVNVHHFADIIIDFLKANDNFGAEIIVSDERTLLLDTGGGILAARHLFNADEPILIHNADILTDFDIAGMIKQHQETSADATLLVSDRNTSRYLLLDDEGRMHGWTNTKTGEVKPVKLEVDGLQTKAFGGVHIISPALFEKLEKFRNEIGCDVFSIMPFYISACSSAIIKGYCPSEKYNWFDIGKLENLGKARKFISENSENH